MDADGGAWSADRPGGSRPGQIPARSMDPRPRNRRRFAVKMISRRSVVLLLALAAVAALVATGAGANSGKKAATVQVCVLLPDTKSSVRWVQFAAPDFAKALKAAGVSYSINNALNDPAKQKAQAQACLAAGATVVVETALDNGSAAAIQN